jgi:hypothetical protein
MIFSYRSTLTIIAIALLGCSIRAMAGGASGTPAQAAGQSAPTLSGPGSLDGIWLNAHYLGSASHAERERVLHTADGKLPPLMPWAADILEKRIKESEQGAPFANTLSQCLPGGVPIQTFGAVIPIQIVETAQQVTILYQEGNRFRVILKNADHPKDPDPSYMGNSVGRWDGNTFVIDSVAFKTRTTIDQIGMPHTAKLHVIERYHRVSKDSLDIVVTIDDPGTFTQTWETKGAYKLTAPGTRMEEDICENNRNTPDDQGHSGFH